MPVITRRRLSLRTATHYFVSVNVNSFYMAIANKSVDTGHCTTWARKRHDVPVQFPYGTCQCVQTHKLLKVYSQVICTLFRGRPNKIKLMEWHTWKAFSENLSNNKCLIFLIFGMSSHTYLLLIPAQGLTITA